MGLDLHARDRGPASSLLRRVVFVALLAVASSAVLPLTHGGTSHVGECGVCSAIVHGSGGVADVVPAAEVPPVPSGTDLEAREPDSAPPRFDFDRRCARAPPVTSVSI